MTSPRRARVWLPFSSGPAEVSIGASSVARFFVPTIIETEQGREFSRYTVMRLLFNLEARGTTNSPVVTIGLIYLPEGSGVAAHSPAAQPSGSWLYQEEFFFGTQSINFNGRVTRDVATKRISRGLHNELFFYVENRSALASLSYHVSGRVLALEA